MLPRKYFFFHCRFRYHHFFKKGRWGILYSICTRALQLVKAKRNRLLMLKGEKKFKVEIKIKKNIGAQQAQFIPHTL